MAEAPTDFEAPLRAFLTDAETFAAKQGLELSTLSHRLFRDSKTLGRLRAGDASCTVRTLTRARKLLNDMSTPVAQSAA